MVNAFMNVVGPIFVSIKTSSISKRNTVFCGVNAAETISTEKQRNKIRIKRADKKYFLFFFLSGLVSFFRFCFFW